ncbi:cell division protein FtsZ [Mesorhizobium sp. M4B.F.Ca.ET.215.01.1.1]|uniref:Cell division protein FtsZ n=1 Tax=Mesorhizobium abyssinicae TaxID=1209958 RepID=A0ABU5ALX7_9HYPH|nr:MULTISPECIES: cell division protein FtsZ [Mesorhizobium]TJW02813.1 MAG: cell division protein FtsZ [Mesorhizobium sp.]MDX8538302.1 cell division protein FtsZ [Mesorhizobium abyssinicae]RUW25987.1 cell division protein FtsZ [Mesorhizobium sp. M4B.F.Ca.ET.013.02.1.1]TGQ11045.1 cell division protein FtsZ [Mesorhizobium sp. M4B.F.Ca.ET.215.01.1.1]TGQ44948.1 cell division protein FtsZ [Mesorhizobium sp. M00.F.Ca.ET.220.01.1.1]
MTINLQKPDITELKPRITVFGVGGGGGNAVNNMITAGLRGVEFVVANTDAQALTMSKAERLIQLGAHVTEGLGAGSQPEVGRAAAEECIDEIIDHLSNTHMCFVTAGMGGGTGTGAAPVVARAAREKGILTVGVVTKPFHFEGQRRMKTADLGIEELQKCVDTLIVIPNQNLFRLANDKTTFADAFAMADQVLYSGVACITDLMVKEGLINLDFADVRSVMREMGKAMMGTGEASGEGRAMAAAEAAIANPLLDETSMKGAKGLLISITGGRDLTLFEVDEAATRIREEVDQDANIILGATFDEELEGVIRVSVVATGIDKSAAEIAAAPISIRAAPQKPVSRPAAPVAESRPAPVQQQVYEPRAVDPVAEAIQLAEANAAAMAQARPAPMAHAEEFRPQSKIFQAPPAQPQPVVQQVVQQPAPLREMPQPVAAAPQRMPRVEDFPPVVKAEVEAKSRPADHENGGPMGLLKRLTNGLTRREEEPARLQPAQPREPKLRQAAPEVRRLASQDPQLYAPRRGQLDDQGRLTPQSRAVQEDDQLEIPAFLRRQAN